MGNGKSRSGSANLIPLNERTKDEQRKIRKKGGIASGERRRKLADLRVIARELLAMPLQGNGRLSHPKSIAEAVSTDANLTAGQRMVLVQLQRALVEGNTRSAEFVRDTAGYKPAPALPEPDEAAGCEDDGLAAALENAAKEAWKE